LKADEEGDLGLLELLEEKEEKTQERVGELN